VVSAAQMRAFAGVASRYSRGFCHITTRQNIQFHFVLLKNVEAAMRELADEGLTTREACGNLGAQYHRLPIRPERLRTRSSIRRRLRRPPRGISCAIR
jgi:sulfite reductase beta subunit-like hemoprotein